MFIYVFTAVLILSVAVILLLLSTPSKYSLLIKDMNIELANGIKEELSLKPRLAHNLYIACRNVRDCINPVNKVRVELGLQKELMIVVYSSKFDISPTYAQTVVDDILSSDLAPKSKKIGLKAKSGVLLG
jgi:hypothetical protein